MTIPPLSIDPGDARSALSELGEYAQRLPLEAQRAIAGHVDAFLREFFTFKFQRIADCLWLEAGPSDKLTALLDLIRSGEPSLASVVSALHEQPSGEPHGA